MKYFKFLGVARIENAAKNNPALLRGATGPAVAILQEAFVALGHPMPKSTRPEGMDGIFGSETFEVTKAFQRQGEPRLTDDGKIGKNTIAKLDARMVAKTRPSLPKPRPSDPRSRPRFPRRAKPKPVPPPQEVIRFEDRRYYDLYLIKKYYHKVVLTMSISFDFAEGLGAEWSSDKEKLGFIYDWREAVSNVWSLPSLFISSIFGVVPFEVRIYAFKENGVGSTEWHATVTKVPKRFAPTSSVFANEVELDSNDLEREKHGHLWQRAAVHEFGHMLGLDDEYKKGNPHINDKNSIMNLGETVRRRHHQEFRNWAKEYLGSV